MDRNTEDFFKDLKKEFLRDLQDRHRLGKDKSSPFPVKMRRHLRLDVASELIMDSYKQTLGAREVLAKEMFEIENRKVTNLHLQKVAKLTNEPLDFKTELVLRR